MEGPITDAAVEAEREKQAELAKQDGTQQSRDEAVDALRIDATRFKLRQALARAASYRSKAATKEQKKKYKERSKKREDMTLEELEAEGRKMTSGGRMKEMYKKKELMREILLKYLKQFTQWAWSSMRYLFVNVGDDGVERCEHDFVYRVKFVCPNDKYMKQGYLESMIVILNGSVYGFQTDNHHGVEEGFKKKGSVRCSNINLLEVVGDARPLASDKAHSLTTIDFSRMIFHSPVWWPTEHIHADLVLNNILTEEDYEARYPTAEDKQTLLRSVQEERTRIEENMAEWDEEEKEREEKLEASTAYQAKFGKLPPVGQDPRKIMARVEAEAAARDRVSSTLSAMKNEAVRADF